MKKISGLLAILIFSGLLLCYEKNVYSGMDGEKLFNTKCARCHTKGGEAPVFGPVKYASSQWERFFSRNKHKRKKDISEQFSPEEIAAIQQYLIDHAADSDRPIAAGMR